MNEETEKTPSEETSSAQNTNVSQTAQSETMAQERANAELSRSAPVERFAHCDQKLEFLIGALSRESPMAGHLASLLAQAEVLPPLPTKTEYGPLATWFSENSGVVITAIVSFSAAVSVALVGFFSSQIQIDAATRKSDAEITIAKEKNASDEKLAKIARMEALIGMLSSKEPETRKYAILAASSLGLDNFEAMVLSSLQVPNDISTLKILANTSQSGAKQSQILKDELRLKSYQLANLADQVKDSDGARSKILAENALFLYPANPIARYRLARFKNCQSAIPEYEKALKDFDSENRSYLPVDLHVSINQRLAECHIELKQVDRARFFYEEVSKILSQPEFSDDKRKAQIAECLKNFDGKTSCVID